ncbi:hypothetical protein MRB53_037261 [Persea americana]|nr:hypothetical protein MRB53_037261 [Persea americana]
MTTRVTRSASKPSVEDKHAKTTIKRPASKKQHKPESEGKKQRQHDVVANASDAKNETEVKHQDFTIEHNDKSIICERRGSGNDKLIYSHGAGGGLNTPATIDFAEGFAQHGSVVSFEGTMNLRSRVKSFKAVIDEIKCQAIGGRSMGSRAAIMARSDQVLILVSYPLVAKTIRDQLLLDLPKVDVLFVIGTNDKMCPIDELNKVREKMKATSWLLQVVATTAMRHATGSAAAKWLEQRPSAFEGTLEWSGEEPVVEWN